MGEFIGPLEPINKYCPVKPNDYRRFILYFYVCDQKRVLDVLELRQLRGTWVLGTGLPSSARAASSPLQPQFPYQRP